jgi:hypothetical protein
VEIVEVSSLSLWFNGMPYAFFSNNTLNYTILHSYLFKE